MRRQWKSRESGPEITLSSSRTSLGCNSIILTTLSQGGPLNFSRQLVTHTRRPSRYARPQTAPSHRERMRWSIAATDEFMGV